MNNLFIAPSLRTGTTGKNFSEISKILDTLDQSSSYLKFKTEINEVVIDMERGRSEDNFVGFIGMRGRRIKSFFDSVGACFLALNAEEQVPLNQIVSERFGATF